MSKEAPDDAIGLAMVSAAAASGPEARLRSPSQL